MIDWHTHILPGMDDGSRSVEQSLEMLALLAQQGVTTVVATPHFYADRESVDHFLARRQAALEALQAKLPQDAPRIRCGAEVSYYSGISRLADLKKLCVEGSQVLLLEMPLSKWSPYTVGELVELSTRGRLTLVLAHIERYMDLQTEDTRQRLYQSGILMQSNATHFLRFGSKGKALAALHRGQIHLLGSDCHNTTSRAPRLGQARARIQKKLGADFMAYLDGFARDLLHEISF